MRIICYSIMALLGATGTALIALSIIIEPMVILGAGVLGAYIGIKAGQEFENSAS